VRVLPARPPATRRTSAGNSRSRSAAAATRRARLVSIHDLGGIAAIKDGKRGFELYVGGGLGAVPHQAKLMMEFCPEEELLPMARAIGRVFARLGEKKNRNKARLKFVVAKLGIDEFKRIVMEERATMPDDPSWRTFFDEIPSYDERPGEKFVQLSTQKKPDGFERWEQTNVYGQRQAGLRRRHRHLPAGDMTSDQMRALADMARRYAGGTSARPSSRTSCSAGCRRTR
jgi:sulfite reductase (ferredoxin)